MDDVGKELIHLCLRYCAWCVAAQLVIILAAWGVVAWASLAP